MLVVWLILPKLFIKSATFAKEDEVDVSVDNGVKGVFDYVIVVARL
jgi:hypothetical protein